jgi:hypothetical protein
MLELHEHFLVGFLGQFLSEIHCPLADMTRNNGQNSEIPGRLDIRRGKGARNRCASNQSTDRAVFAGRPALSS